MWLRRIATAVGFALATSVVVAAPARADAWSGPYSVPYSPVLVQVREDPQEIYLLSYVEWQSMGFPAPVPAPTEFGKYAWSPTIAAASQFGPVTYLEELPYEAWAYSGFPTPTTVPWIPGTEVWHWRTSTDEVFAQFGSRSPRVHKLTEAEWVAMGAPAPEARMRGYYNLSWYPEAIGGSATPDERAATITLEDWLAWDRPTPETLPVLPHDLICRYQNTDALTYQGGTFWGDLTLEQWAGTGYAPFQECFAPA